MTEIPNGPALDFLDLNRRRLAETALQAYYTRYPDARGLREPAVREQSLEDMLYHLDHLFHAAACHQPVLFLNYLEWLKISLAARQIPPVDILESLDALHRILQEELPESLRTPVLAVLLQGLEQFPDLATASSSEIDPLSPHADLINTYITALRNADQIQGQELIMQALENGLSIEDLYLHVLEPALKEIGRLWQANEISTAHEHFATACIQMLMANLYTRFILRRNGPPVFLGVCADNELHEMGIRMISDFFEIEGWTSHYLGANMPVKSVLEYMLAQHTDVIGISVTMIRNLCYVRDLITEIRKQADLDHVKILVGGYLINIAPSIREMLGADGSGRNAQEAVASARRLVGKAYPAHES